MRRLFLISYFILFGIAAPATASSQTITAEAQARVAAILAQFPDGGAGLSDAIAAAVEADPTLAAAVVAAALTATPAQQRAIGTGMALAAKFFAESAAGTGPAADAAKNAELLIEAAMGSAPTIAQTAFAAGGGFTTLTTALGGGTTNLSTGTCISPSGPGGTCR